MSLGDLFRAVIQWLHALAAVAWVGGGIFYWWVLRPTFRSAEASPSSVRMRAAVAVGFKELVDTAILVLLVTGGVQTFDRLSGGRVNTAYVVLLAIKIVLAGGMFFLARRMSRNVLAATDEKALDSATPETMPSDSGLSGGLVSRVVAPANLALILGLLVFLLASLLRAVYEASLRAG